MAYRALSKEIDEIRLLSIADDGSEPIACRIEHVSLRDSPSYKALSYCWGNAKNTKTILVNGYEMAVTVNLEHVLRQFRGEGQGWIWIDALCINQSDLGERGEQVLRMGEIFSKAVDVIAWLGPERDDSNRAMEFMKVFDQIALEVEVKGHKLDWRKPISAEECRAEDESSWAALQALLMRPYWTRLWVVQEIAMARHVVIRCGAARTNFDDLAASAWITHRRKFHASFQDNTLPLLPPLVVIVGLSLGFRERGCRQYKPKDIASVIRLTHSHVATDPRDYVYGVLTLTTDGAQLVGRPRYDEPVEDLCIRLTRSLILTRKRLDFICFKYAWDIGLKLPSWVLDISRPCLRYDPNTATVCDVPLIWPTLDASLEKPVFLKRSGDEDACIMKIAGLRLDEIDGFGVAQGGAGGIIMVQPDSQKNGYFSECDMQDAIIQSILSFEHGRDTEALISLGWKKLWQTQTSHPTLPGTVEMTRWKNQNRDLLIAGRRLEDWALGGPDSVPLEMWRKSFPDLREEGLDNGFAENLLLSFIYSNFQKWLNWCRKILVTKNGYVVDGHAQAKKGDLVCFLKDCWKAAVLRPTDDGFFRIIGDAIVAGFGEGTENFMNLQRQIDEGRTETFDII